MAREYNGTALVDGKPCKILEYWQQPAEYFRTTQTPPLWCIKIIRRSGLSINQMVSVLGYTNDGKLFGGTATVTRFDKSRVLIEGVGMDSLDAFPWLSQSAQELRSVQQWIRLLKPVKRARKHRVS